MIDWLIAQQGVLSLALGLLIICEHFFTNKIGVSLSYKLWALVPACLIVNNLPMSLVSIPSSAFTRYVVGVKPTLGADNFATWFTLWAIGVTIITTYVLVHHIATWTSISKRHALHTNAYYSSKAPMPMLFGFIKPKGLADWLAGWLTDCPPDTG